MKKGLCLFLAFIMLFSFACAEETAQDAAEQPADLLNLWNCSGESAAWAASAIPISDGILLVSIAVKDIPAEQLVISDGTRQWEAAAVIPDTQDCFTLVFYDPGDAPAHYGMWQLLPIGYSVDAATCTVRFGDSMGSRINRGVISAEEINWKQQRCYLLTLTGSAPAGSPVLTEDGQLAGVVIAEWAERENTVLALPAEGIARAVSNVAELLSGMPEWSDAPEGLTVTMNKNRATIDWNAMTLPETKDGEQAWIVLVDTGNNYLTSYPADLEGKKLIALLTPGRFYIVGPVVSAGRPSELPASYASVFVPQAEPLAKYNFKAVCTAIAEAPEGGLQGGAPVPVTEVTEELLRSGRAYFYSHSAYEVVTTYSDLSLLVTLTDPDGNNYRYESSWVYSPDYMKEDIWYISLKDMGLTGSLDESGYPAGIYTLDYYIDGELADTYIFELKQ